MTTECIGGAGIAAEVSEALVLLASKRRRLGAVSDPRHGGALNTDERT